MTSSLPSVDVTQLPSEKAAVMMVEGIRDLPLVELQEIFPGVREKELLNLFTGGSLPRCIHFGGGIKPKCLADTCYQIRTFMPLVWYLDLSSSPGAVALKVPAEETRRMVAEMARMPELKEVFLSGNAGMEFPEDCFVGVDFSSLGYLRLNGCTKLTVAVLQNLVSNETFQLSCKLDLRDCPGLSDAIPGDKDFWQVNELRELWCPGKVMESAMNARKSIQFCFYSKDHEEKEMAKVAEIERAAKEAARAVKDSAITTTRLARLANTISAERKVIKERMDEIQKEWEAIKAEESAVLLKLARSRADEKLMQNKFDQCSEDLVSMATESIEKARDRAYLKKKQQISFLRVRLANKEKELAMICGEEYIVDEEIREEQEELKRSIRSLNARLELASLPFDDE